MIKIIGEWEEWEEEKMNKRKGKIKARDKRNILINKISGFCKFYGNKMIFAKYFIFFASVSFP